jgi:peptide/nickel transport system substrate-binding protein
MKKRDFLKLSSAATAGLAFGAAPPRAYAQSTAGTLRVAMTAADIPLTTGQPNQGAEGVRFMGITVYDGLTRWDLSKSDVAAKIVPDLAESWSVSATDKRVWTFKLRQGVRFHDGSAFNADAVVWNLDKLLSRNAPQFDATQAAQGGLYTGGIASWRKLDDNTVEITTKVIDAVLPYSLASVFMSSPAQYEKMGRDWSKVAEHPSGTGPWKLESFKPRERADLVRNTDHWDKARIPKCERLILFPIPEANTRVAALLSGRVDWIEAPPPDAVARLKQQKMQIVTNLYPHVWPYMLSFEEGSPFRDIRVRKAANMAIDRQGLVTLLGGLAAPARGMVNPGHPWFGNPTTDLSYNPAAAKKLLAEAGYGEKNPVKVKFAISPAGSGQMQPLPMNEFIQQNLAEVGIKVDFEVVEWNQLINIWRAGATDPSAKGGQSLNFTYFIQDPFTGFIRHMQCNLKAPSGTNWGHYCDPEMDKLLDEVRNSFDPKEQTTVLQKVHEKMVNEALFLMVTHDVNARALSPKVKNFVQAKNWFQDFSPISMGN